MFLYHSAMGLISHNELAQGIALYAQGKLKIAVNQAHTDFVKGGNWGRRVIYFSQDRE